MAGEALHPLSPVDRPTLAVPLTPPGRGAVALILVSGPEAGAVVTRLLESGALPAPGRMRHVWLCNERGERLDDALVVHEATCHPLTGGPGLELGIHGGPAVIAAVMQTLEEAGARTGEWKGLLEQARRNRAVDPLRLAAYRRLHRTVSRSGAAILARALSGELHQRLRLALDRVEQGDGAGLRELAHESRAARACFQGLRVVLIGPPNAGKSTLFNSLLGWDRATVSSDPGTTRDAVEEDLLVDDMPVRLTDTAGSRAGSAPDWWRPRRNRVRVYVVDGAAAGLDPAWPAGISPEGGVAVVNKIDQLDPAALARFPDSWVRMSAREGVGREALLEAVLRAGGVAAPMAVPGAVVFTRRDRKLLETSLETGPVAEKARVELRARTHGSP